ncbi:SDR family oxidoreductase [Streptomyces sulfonofaciens]|uniref:SDR family oxidoreductase n=1 Tax=Streptomyces sulfonofaciens TaxID=68272 RepID=UPI001E5EB12A|nr:SDR family oxidoreductase [Streptomyces sulfonofaciens]
MPGRAGGPPRSADGTAPADGPPTRPAEPRARDGRSGWRRGSAHRVDQVDIGSINGEVGIAGSVLYGARKPTVHSVTRSWAAEDGPAGVRVRPVAPGPTLTEHVAANGGTVERLVPAVPSRRASTPAEVAAAGGVPDWGRRGRRPRHDAVGGRRPHLPPRRRPCLRAGRRGRWRRGGPSGVRRRPAGAA